MRVIRLALSSIACLAPSLLARCPSTSTLAPVDNLVESHKGGESQGEIQFSGAEGQGSIA